MPFLILLKLFLLPLIALGLLTALVPYLMKVDILILKNQMSEISLTELSQQALLVIGVMVFYWSAKADKKGRSFWVLVAGFLSCMLIRELDYYLDSIVHGFWVYPAVILATATIVYAIKNTQNLVETATSFKTTHSYFNILMGLLIILFFSRLFGTGSLWSEIMQADYQHLYKTAIQESLELLGYLFLAIGSVQHGLGIKKLKN